MRANSGGRSTFAFVRFNLAELKDLICSSALQLVTNPPDMPSSRRIRQILEAVSGDYRFSRSRAWARLGHTALLAIGVSLTLSPSARALECARSGQSNHSIAVTGNFSDSRFSLSLAAPVANSDFILSLGNNAVIQRRRVVSWLLPNLQPQAREVLSGEAGANLIERYFANPNNRRQLALRVVGGDLIDSIQFPPSAPAFTRFFDGLAPQQDQAVAQVWSQSEDRAVAELGNRLALTIADNPNGVDSIYDGLSQQTSLLQRAVTELLTVDDASVNPISIDLLSSTAFTPILLNQTESLTGILAQPGGLQSLLPSSGQVDLGQRLEWLPEEEIGVKVDYGYDVLSWLTLRAGYGYFGARLGKRNPTRLGVNPDFALGRIRTAYHRLDFGFDVGCYFDVWRPNLQVGASVSYNRFYAQDPLLGEIRNEDVHPSYLVGLGLDVDLTEFVEIGIGYQWRFYPQITSSQNYSINYTPQNFSSPIVLNNVAGEWRQSARASDFYVLLRFFL